MAKIIGYKKTFKKHYKSTCDSCGAIIVFDENEIKDNYQYNEYCFSSGTCPNCGAKVSFDKHHSKAKDEDIKKACVDLCNHFKNGKCTYCGTDWRECPIS